VRLDLRLAKSVLIRRVRLQISLDAYNALNANSVRAVNSSYGSAWRRPQQISIQGFSRSVARSVSDRCAGPAARRGEPAARASQGRVR
jgi:hypothetical protein